MSLDKRCGCGNLITTGLAYCDTCIGTVDKLPHPEDYGICKITNKPCHERGLCHITGNRYKPLDIVTIELIDTGIKSSYELSNFDESLYPNWQCTRFQRIRQKEVLKCPSCGGLVYKDKNHYWCERCDWNSNFKPQNYPEIEVEVQNE